MADWDNEKNTMLEFPYRLRLKYTRNNLIVVIFGALFFFLAALLALCGVFDEQFTYDFTPLLFGILAAAIALFFLYFLFCSIFGQNYIELSSEGICVHIAFSHRKMLWTEIAYVQPFESENSLEIQVFSREQYQYNLDNPKFRFSDLYKTRFTIILSTALFQNIPMEALFNTINSCLKG